MLGGVRAAGGALRRWLARSRHLVAARPRLAIGGVLAVVTVLFAGPWGVLSAASTAHRYDVERVPARPVALVLGAGITPDGQPTPFLAHRLDLAVRLWRLGKVQHVLVSGDHSRVDHDEVAVMTRYLTDRGVPGDRVTQDHAGFTTYDSCYRARAAFGVTAAIVVTNDYHLARALWTCRHLGVDAVGVGAHEGIAGHVREAVKDQGRELLADGKALVETVLTRPLPHFLGPREIVR